MNVSATEYQATGIRFLRTSDISARGEIHDRHPVFVPPDRVAPEHLLVDGDLLISRSGTVGRCALYRGDGDPVTHAGYLVRLRLRSDVERRFIWYVTQSAPFLDAIEMDTIQSTIGNFNAQKMGELRIPLPPPQAQQTIVQFLDLNAARIDRLVEKKEELLALIDLQYERATELAYAEEIPRRRVRDVTTLVQCGPFGSQLGFSDYVPGGTPLINPQDLTRRGIVPNPATAVSEGLRLQLARHALRTGDLVLARRGQMGRAAVVRPDHEAMLCGTGSMLLRPRTSIVISEFMNLLLNSQFSRTWLQQNAVGTTMANLSAGIVRRLPVPVPPVALQRQLIEEIESLRAQSAALLDAVMESERKLREYRAGLITAAVTGQIDVGSAA